ncbi:hypothetical protein YB2330_000319 [Saitoella coloradoensis]
MVSTGNSARRKGLLLQLGSIVYVIACFGLLSCAAEASGALLDVPIQLLPAVQLDLSIDFSFHQDWFNPLQLRRRADTNTTTELLSDDVVLPSISETDVHHYYFTTPAGSSNDNDNETVYNVSITLSTCTQPSPTNSSANLTEVYASPGPPPLYLWVSNTTSNTLPGPPSTRTDVQEWNTTYLGFTNFTMINVTAGTSVYIGVSAPNLTSTTVYADWSGEWSYQLGVSTTSPLHAVQAGVNTFVQDTDSVAALISSNNLTSNTTNENRPPFGIFLNPSNNDFVLTSLANSYCAIAESVNPTLKSINDADVMVTTNTPGQIPQEFFYVKSLNASTPYNAYLTLANTGRPGGTVYQMQNLTTKTANTTCRIIYNLSFCDSVAYAVPGNDESYDTIANWYDAQAASLYQNFTHSLAQYPCNITDSARYSLSDNVTCDNCAAAYKTWLCSTLIPRCQSTDPFRMYPSRNASTSRNPSLVGWLPDNAEYYEVLPCKDLCYAVVQMCPVDLGFTCPTGGGLKDWYGADYEDTDRTNITCNAPWVTYKVNGADALWPRGGGETVMWVIGLVCVHLAFVWV